MNDDKPKVGEVITLDDAEHRRLPDPSEPLSGAEIRTAFWTAIRWRGARKLADQYRKTMLARAAAGRAAADVEYARVEYERALQKLRDIDTILETDTTNRERELYAADLAFELTELEGEKRKAELNRDIVRLTRQGREEKPSPDGESKVEEIFARLRVTPTEARTHAQEEIDKIHRKAGDRELTEEEQAEVDEIKAIRDWIIRTSLRQSR